MPANVAFMRVSGAVEVYSPDGVRSENVAVGGASARSSNTSDVLEYVRVTTDTDCYVRVAPNATATVGDLLLMSGQVLDIGPCAAGTSVAVIAK